MSKLKFKRKGSIIITLSDDGNDRNEDFKFINQAKKESVRLQVSNGGMGGGSLEVVK